MNDDLKIIKKKYGEKMMHLCRELFPTLLETEGLLSSLLLNYFEPSRFLYDDIIENRAEQNFRNYIYSLIEIEKKEKTLIKKTPQQLLNEAGYYLYECKTEQDIQSFKKYYAPSEKLCTFHGGRLDRCYVFFAVKKNVDEIKRKNFKTPQREDEYGTSVISIQFSKGELNILSIKNRYNHTVKNPDATFSNNLDNIIPGLTNSFEREYNLNLNYKKNQLHLPNYVQANNGKIFKYNYEINNVYYCPNNIIIDNFEVINTYQAQERYIIIDYFILDLMNKKIELYDPNINDCFTDGIKNISKINIQKEESTKIIEIITTEQKRIVIKIDNTNKIIGYYNEVITETNKPFLNRNEKLENLELPNLIKVADLFLYFNTELSIFKAPNLKEVGDLFLYNNQQLLNLNLPNLITIGDRFIYTNRILNNLNLPNLKKIGNNFLSQNLKLVKLELPNLTEVADFFLLDNTDINEVYLPNLEKVGNFFLKNNIKLEYLSLPNLISIGNSFLARNTFLQEINLPKLKKINNLFLYRNTTIQKINLSSLPFYYIKIIDKKSANQYITKLIKEQIKNRNYKIKEYKKIILNKIKGK